MLFLELEQSRCKNSRMVFNQLLIWRIGMQFFRIDKKKKTFRISEFSYGGYRVGESGTLVYKGDKLVDFK